MHILIAFITALAGLIWGLSRWQDAGLNLNAFNPFWWYRRNQWQKLYRTKPIHTLEKPVEAAALLLVGTVKSEGEISREQKEALLKIFKKDFNQSGNAAADLLGASIFLLKDVMDFRSEIPHILAPSREKFSETQIQSLFNLLILVSHLEGDATEEQQQILEDVKSLFASPAEDNLWS